MAQKPFFPVVQRGDPLNRGLVAAWLMSEGAGTALHDASGNGASGTFNGTAPPAWIAGNRGRALSFTYGSSGVSLPSVPSLFISGSFSASAWIWIPPGYHGGIVVVQDPGGGYEGYYYLVGFGTGGIKVPQFQGNTTGGGAVVSANTPVDDGKWHHVAVTDDESGNVLFYLDGKPDGGGTSGPVGPYVTTGLIGNLLGGYLSDLRLWNRVLSGAEVARLYRASYDEMRPAWRPELLSSAASAAAVALAARGGAMGAARAEGTFAGLIAMKGLAVGTARAQGTYAGLIAMKGLAVGTARATGTFSAVLAARSAARSTTHPGASFAVPLAGRAIAAAVARASARFAARLAARSIAAGAGRAGIFRGALFALMARSFGIGTGRATASYSAPMAARGTGVGTGRGAPSGRVALAARACAAGFARAGAAFTAELRARSAARSTGSAQGRSVAALSARGGAASFAAAAVSTGATLAARARGFAMAMARAALALARAPTINPTLEIVASQKPQQGQRNVLTLTGTNAGPLEG